ncbi:MAG: hypothetical protein Q4F07_03555, partial [Bacteroidales bacterium]|nr:hypothetical protein [Bacteroidales bacterium]
QRPGGNTPQRPGGNGPQRPGGGYTPGHGPGGNHGHHRPGTPPPPRPGGGHHHGGYRPGPPPRPHMPAHRPWRPPVPPPNFRPYYGAPSFTGILGLTFGTALGITLSNLANTGYNVTGYGNDCIYLSNVPMFNLSWPNATLNYVNGNLRGSEFTYSTPGYDMSRYNMLYNSLVAQYGYPVSVQNNGGYNVSATWWGYNNGYITLSYFSDYAYNGTMRYYTTLSIGN